MDMQINKNFLRRERERRAWSQSHLAEVAGLSMRTVQRIEHSGIASMESTKALATALDLTLSKLTETSAEDIKQTEPQPVSPCGIYCGLLRSRLARSGRHQHKKCSPRVHPKLQHPTSYR